MGMITVYGIPNCDTVRKARGWLETHGVDYTFHDFRKRGLNRKLVQHWVETVGWESLLNRRGTTWRKLAPESRESIDRAAAIRIMLESPSVIRRPILDTGTTIVIGFSPENYSALLN